MADGDEDDDEDEGDDGEDGDDDDQEGDQQGDDADDSKIQDEEMTDAVDEPKPPTPTKPVVDAMDGISQTDVVPPNPLTLAPPLASLATSSPKPEGSPLKHVMLQSPTEAQAPDVLPPVSDILPPVESVPVSIPSLAPEPGLPLDLSQITDSETKTESMIAEPPSTIAGDEGKAVPEADVTMSEAVVEEAPAMVGEISERVQTEEVAKSPSPKQATPDIPPREEEALLPPPPEQVGNISSPKADFTQERVSDSEDKSRENHQSDSGLVPERPPLHAHDSVMTEDTIKPEDSASVRFPLTESGAPSEVGTASAEETKDSATAAPEPMVQDVKEPSPPKQISPAAEARIESPLVSDIQPIAAKQREEPERLEEHKDEPPKEATSPQPQPAIHDEPQPLEPKISPPAPEPERESTPDAKEPTPPTPAPDAPRDEPMSALEEPKEVTPREDPPVHEADVAMGESNPEPISQVAEPAVEQSEPEKPEPKEEVKDEPMEEPKVEPVSEPAPEPAVTESLPAALPAEAEAKSPPPVVHEPVAEPPVEPAPVPHPTEGEEKKEEKKEDPPTTLS